MLSDEKKISESEFQSKSQKLKERIHRYDRLIDTNKKLMDIIYGGRFQFIEAKNLHPIEEIIIDQYDSVLNSLTDPAHKCAKFLGITLPITTSGDTELHEKLVKYLTFEKEHLIPNGKNMHRILEAQYYEYEKLDMAERYYNRLDDYMHEEWLKINNQTNKKVK